MRPTATQLTNPKNLQQLQERVHQALKVYEGKFNLCHTKARTPDEADYCADQLYSDLTVNFETQLKRILSEY
jgi:hypothetical protein